MSKKRAVKKVLQDHDRLKRTRQIARRIDLHEALRSLAQIRVIAEEELARTSTATRPRMLYLRHEIRSPESRITLNEDFFLPKGVTKIQLQDAWPDYSEKLQQTLASATQCIEAEDGHVVLAADLDLGLAKTTSKITGVVCRVDESGVVLRCENELVGVAAFGAFDDIRPDSLPIGTSREFRIDQIIDGEILLLSSQKGRQAGSDVPKNVERFDASDDNSLYLARQLSPILRSRKSELDFSTPGRLGLRLSVWHTKELDQEFLNRYLSQSRFGLALDDNDRRTCFDVLVKQGGRKDISAKIAKAHAGVEAIVDLATSYVGMSDEWKSNAKLLREAIDKFGEHASTRAPDERGLLSGLSDALDSARKSLVHNRYESQTLTAFGSRHPTIQHLQAFVQALAAKKDLESSQKSDAVHLLNYWRAELRCNFYFKSQRVLLSFIANKGTGKIALRLPGRNQGYLYSKALFPQIEVRSDASN